MSLAIEELRAGAPGPAAVEAFLHGREVPIVEGRDVTFLFRGEATTVRLIHWIHGLESAQAFSRLPGTDLWYLTLDLPRRSRMEYKLGVELGPHRRLVRDPLNPKLAHDPFGANSVVHGEGYAEPDWIAPEPDARVGEMRSMVVPSRAFGGQRTVDVYLPARFRDSRRYPLLIAHDGHDYVQFARLRTVLDNLIHRLEIPPLVVALTTSQDRMHEYAGDDRHAGFLVDDLLPELEKRMPLVAEASARALMGASLGGLASLHAAWRHPGVFGKLMLQSGSFVFTDIGNHDKGPAWDRIVERVNAFRKAPGKPSEKAFVSCGVYEGLIYYNRSMVPLLQDTGMEVRYREARDGHNWENWRDRLREGLSWLFPGPLWMVYE